MNYHIDTGIIYEKFAENCECPLCQIQKIVTEQFLHEFLNDAVMEDNSRIAVSNKGFCNQHFDMLFSRQNKLSVALQIRSRAEKLLPLLKDVKNVGTAKKLAAKIKSAENSCVICDLVNESMKKYYITVAQMFAREKNFFKTLLKTNGFCLTHYAELLNYSSHAGFAKKEYLALLSKIQRDNFERVDKELKAFCDSHDYRNAYKPLGNAEDALPRMRVKIYGEKQV